MAGQIMPGLFIWECEQLSLRLNRDAPTFTMRIVGVPPAGMNQKVPFTDRHKGVVLGHSIGPY